MKFSLVMATINRRDEIKRFLASLREQSYRDFELIVVDQNDDERVAGLLAPYADKFAIKHVRSAKGLSRARNVGLRYATGDVIAFPDDDCWYSRDLLRRVAQLLLAHPAWDGLTGRCEDGKGQAVAIPWAESRDVINLMNVWRTAISITIFLRREVVKEIGDFDEELGVGAGTAWGSSEETDYVIRALKNGRKIFYEPSIVVYHPRHVAAYDAAAMKRAISYGAGMGRVLCKHHYPRWYIFYKWLRPAGGVIFSLMSCRFAKSRYHWHILFGRVKGWLG